MIRIVPRTQFGFWAAAFPLLLALAITVVVGFLVMVAMSEQPLSDTWTLLTFPWQARTASGSAWAGQTTTCPHAQGAPRAVGASRARRSRSEENFASERIQVHIQIFVGA